MQWARRVKPWRIRRLYHFAKFGIYDDELLLLMLDADLERSDRLARDLVEDRL